MKKQSGFTVIEAGLLVVIVAIIGAVGFVAYEQLNKSDTTTDTQAQASSQQVTIKSDKDLDTASNQLDTLNLDDTDTATLDQKSGDF